MEDLLLPPSSYHSRVPPCAREREGVVETSCHWTHMKEISRVDTLFGHSLAHETICSSSDETQRETLVHMPVCLMLTKTCRHSGSRDAKYSSPGITINCGLPLRDALRCLVLEDILPTYARFEFNISRRPRLIRSNKLWQFRRRALLRMKPMTFLCLIFRANLKSFRVFAN